MCLQPAREDSFPELLAARRDCILSDKGLKRNAFALGTALDTQMKHNKVTVICGSVTESHSLASTWPRTRAIFPRLRSHKVCLRCRLSIDSACEKMGIYSSWHMIYMTL